MKILLRFLRLADIMDKENDQNGLKILNSQFNLFIKKHSHYVPTDNKNAPKAWRRNMDYNETENSPYFGSITEFLKKFPNGIGDWVKWRRKNRKKINKRLGV